MAATGWKLPTATAQDAGSGTWTSPGSITADDGVEATYSLAVKSTTGPWNRGQNLGFDAAVPATAMLVKVEYRVEWRVNNAGGVGILEAQAFVGVTGISTVAADSAEPVVLTTLTTDITAARTWARVDLLDGTFEVRVRGRNGNSATDPSYRFDHVAAQVTYLTFDTITYRFRNDDGSETTATWKAAQNTGVTLGSSDHFRLRVEIQETSGTVGSGGPNGAWFRWQYNKNGAGWNDISNASAVVRTATSPNFADGATSTDQLTNATGTFVGTSGMDSGDTIHAIANLPFSGQTELEVSLTLQAADLAPGDTIQFRVLNGRLAGTPGDYNPMTYTQTPTVTIAGAAPAGKSPQIISAGMGYF